MTMTIVSREIKAPVDKVFDTIANVENFEKAVPDIKNVQIIAGDGRSVGTRFVETRLMKGREASTELVIKEYVENQRVRMVSEAGGAIWDSAFDVAAKEGGTQLTLTMEAIPQKFLAKLTTPLLKGMVQKAVESDMDAVKAYCEG